MRGSWLSIAIGYVLHGSGDFPCSDGSIGLDKSVGVGKIDVMRPIREAVNFYTIYFKEEANVVAFSFIGGVDGARFSAIFTSRKQQ